MTHSLRAPPQLRLKWQWAARRIIFSNRLILGSKKLVVARRLARKTDLYLGYMVTSFNHLTFEKGDALELLLDWFDAANKVFKLPDTLMQGLLKGALRYRLAAARGGHMLQPRGRARTRAA